METWYYCKIPIQIFQNRRNHTIPVFIKPTRNHGAKKSRNQGNRERIKEAHNFHKETPRPFQESQRSVHKV